MWIEHVSEEDATGEVARLYASLGRSGPVDNIVKSASLVPAGLDAILRFYKRVMHGPGELDMGQRELIAVAVSVVNECEY